MTSFQQSAVEYARRVSDDFPLDGNVNRDLELLRFNSFQNCPPSVLQNFSFIRLAAAGFYYVSDDESCRCFSCGFSIRNETTGDNSDPLSVHRELSPSCRFIQCQESTTRYNGSNNISTNDLTATRNGISGEVRISQNVDTTYRYNGGNVEDTGLKQGSEFHNNVSRTNMDTGYSTLSGSSSHATGQSVARDTEGLHPVYPEYRKIGKRLSTFDNWPGRQSSYDMAAAGFFYTGLNDCVKCFHCGIALQEWQPNEIPWKEHARWSHECDFLIQNKPSDVESPRFKMLHSQATPESAVNVGTTTDNTDLLAGYMTESVANGSTQMLSEDNIQDYMGSAAVLAVLEHAADREKEETYIKEALECLCLGHHRPVAVQIYSVVEKLKDRDNRIRKSVKGHHRPAAVQIYSVVEKLKDRDNRIRKSVKEKEKYQQKLMLRECGICYHEERCVMFCPCGHIFCCEQCASTLLRQINPKCPACRCNIAHTTKIFWA